MTALKPQDLAAVLKVIAFAIAPDRDMTGKRNWTYDKLARDLFLSASETHAALKRAEQAKLFDLGSRTVKLKNLEDFMLHGMQYAFYVQPGVTARGIPTSFAAPPLVFTHFDDPDVPPVWEHPLGLKRGYCIEPLYKNAPKAALGDPDFYELLALADALREGGSRIRVVAAQELKERFEKYRICTAEEV
jgi:hypothetical protein